VSCAVSLGRFRTRDPTFQINASINNSSGLSSQLANQFVAAFRLRKPDAGILVRDVFAARGGLYADTPWDTQHRSNTPKLSV